MIKGRDWQSLSIAKGQSATYNEKKFAQPKRREHFTKEILDQADDECRPTLGGWPKE